MEAGNVKDEYNAAAVYKERYLAVHNRCLILHKFCLNNLIRRFYRSLSLIKMIRITCMVNFHKTQVDIITSCIGLHYNCNLLTMLRIKSLNCI